MHTLFDLRGNIPGYKKHKRDSNLRQGVMARADGRGLGRLPWKSRVIRSACRVAMALPGSKKRVGLAGRGKRGGARTLVATNKGTRWFFLYGFEKNDRANITGDELEALKEIAEQLLARTGKQLDEAVQDGSLQEICHEN